MFAVVGKTGLGHLLLAFAMMLPATVRATDATSPLVLERTIPLDGVSGRIDHLAIDLGRKRLYVAELGNGTVDVVDVATGKVLQRIAGLAEPQGVGYIPTADLIAVASAGDGSVRLFRADDFSPAGTVELGDDADNVRLDGRTGGLVVGYGSGGLAELDPVSRSVARRAALHAHPEGFQLDPASGRAFVNLPDARQVAVVDLATGRQVATWEIPGLHGNFPMAVNDTGTFMAIAYRDPPRLVLFDTQSGVPRQNLATCNDADDIFFDARRRRIYVSCGEGVVDVLQQEPDGYRSIGRIATRSGARTSLFVPDQDRLFVAARARFFGLGTDAEILVFRPVP